MTYVDDSLAHGRARTDLRRLTASTESFYATKIGNARRTVPNLRSVPGRAKFLNRILQATGPEKQGKAVRTADCKSAAWLSAMSFIPDSPTPISYRIGLLLMQTLVDMDPKLPNDLFSDLPLCFVPAHAMARMHQRLDRVGIDATVEALRPLLGWCLCLRLYGARDEASFALPLPAGLAYGKFDRGVPVILTVIAETTLKLHQHQQWKHLKRGLGEPIRMPRIGSLSLETVSKVGGLAMGDSE